MPEIDTNRILSEALTDLTKSFFKKLSDISINFFSKQYNYLMEDFSNYLIITYNRCSQLKIIIDKTNVYNLDDLYVQTYFRGAGKTYSDENLIEKARDGERLIVTGFGGVGKTIFSKRLWLSVFSEPQGKIPIFFELRALNKINDVELITLIRHSISVGKSNLTEELFVKFLKDGRFILIFDGFDELDESKRQIVEKQVIDISSKYLGCGIVVSSRMDERFSAWERFRIYKAKPFDQKQVKNLISRIEYDASVRKKFISEIIDKRFKEYESFLQTPLLALMMLMTYSQSGEVPDKRSLFYKYAFLTLYSWHDGFKEAFKRESKSGLDMFQFEKVFSIFCLMTYAEYQFQVDNKTMLETLSRVKRHVDFDFDVMGVVREIVESVNLMYIEGEYFVFTHRSFQEYFTACACISYFQDKLIDLTDKLYRGNDSVLSLMNEINEEVVDRFYILKLDQSVMKELDSIVLERDFHKLAEILRLELFIVIFQSIEKKIYSKNFDFSYFVYSKNKDFLTWQKIVEFKKKSDKDISEKLSNKRPNSKLSKAVKSLYIEYKKNHEKNDSEMFRTIINYSHIDKKIYFRNDYISINKIDENLENIVSYEFDIENYDKRWIQENVPIFKSLCVFVRSELINVARKNKNRNRSIDDIIGI